LENHFGTKCIESTERQGDEGDDAIDQKIQFTNKSSWRATCQRRRKPRIKATLTLPFEKQDSCVKILDTQKKRDEIQ
jgi:hypothetical protein